MNKKREESALKVNRGIEQPPAVNPYITNFYRNRKVRLLSDKEYLDGILKGDISILSRAITLVESQKEEHKEQAQRVVSLAIPHAVHSMRIGITGVPGVGKSTFVEAFGSIVTERGYKLAVLAIDPSSERSKGSILGDKTRMERLSVNPKAFIRPSPSGGSLGGVARKTRESIILCEAAGYNMIFIETVGVGQSETVVHSMTDLFLLLMLSGAGDELQGIKRGIMEMSDLISITKADGDNIDKAKLAQALYNNALRLFPPQESGWSPKALRTSAITGDGLELLLQEIESFFSLIEGNGYLHHKRGQQSKYWMYQTIQERLNALFFENQSIKSVIKEYEKMAVEGQITSYAAANALISKYIEQ
ncbi:MAG: methylmalonyl Co-A mutase-associated GTPase MeaB [Bacteroidales bacterium]